MVIAIANDTDLVAQSNPFNIQFTKITDAGFSRKVAGEFEFLTEVQKSSAGIAAGDYDQDGDVDLYVVGRRTDPNHLYQNQGNGTFVEVGEELGVNIRHWGSGPAWGDIDGDGDLDLFVGAVANDLIYLFENRVNEEEGKFIDITTKSKIISGASNTVSALFFDYDVDGYLDLFLTHWRTSHDGYFDTRTVYRNNGDKTFTSVSRETGIAEAVIENFTDWTYTPNLVDIDNDGDADLLMAADAGDSQVIRNNGDGTFTRITDRDVIKDQFGMGAAVGDFNNDGHMDWFVTSIYNLDVRGGDRIGNRLYRNLGNGEFEDVTNGSGVSDGAWGWGACAGDFDHDGHLDMVQVNGWSYLPDDDKDYSGIPIRFFRNKGTNSMEFDEVAASVDMIDAGQGRGLACFDADLDGDLDVVVVNNSQDHIVYYRNDTSNDNHYLTLRLDGITDNRFGVGARVTVTTEFGKQIRVLGGSNNYVSHNPLEVHFGLSTATEADIQVTWPDQTVTTLNSVPANLQLTIRATESATRLIVVHGSGTGGYDSGEEIEIEARSSEEGYFFSHWTSNGEGYFEDIYSPTTLFTMPDGNVTVTAHYLPGVGPDADVSVARRWNEVLLAAIRNDYARPTVHARNLFHISAAMYDAWASYESVERAWLLGSEQAGYSCEWEASPTSLEDEEILEHQRIAASFAAYRLITHRFRASIGSSQTLKDVNSLMSYLNYDASNESTDWKSGSAAELGNYIANCYIEFGMFDGSNEANEYSNLAYQPVNPPLQPELPGNPTIVDLNRWQPLRLQEFIDQAGNPSTEQPDFLSPEWGSVWPFALEDSELSVYTRDGFDYWVYHDPSAPPMIDGLYSDSYKWGFSLVSVWSSHLDPTDGVMIDISPASLGNIRAYPVATDYESYEEFFNLLDGGDTGQGYSINPITGMSYEPQVVPRGDYTRVLAEFWADGPDSETPPGHWFVIANEVNDHPLLERRLEGSGPVLDELEWNVKLYFVLGGAMHDAAISAWGIKGWYDYIRPISALRAMADRGQSTNAEIASYHVDGIPLVDGFIEVVGENDALAGDLGEHTGKIKLYAWNGPNYIDDPAQDVAGVGWILAENWWPYQRPTFVTPPFAGFVSGHSTYSRSAAEVLTAFTGSAYFPGGMSSFEVKANKFLVFEKGPSVDMTLQWATYYDAADQCSLSRIWGGIHPPADDIPGRLIGVKIGTRAFELAMSYFSGQTPADWTQLHPTNNWTNEPFRNREIRFPHAE